MLGNPNLTGISAEQAATMPGQASFALTDTEHTCRQCLMWSNQRGERTKLGLLQPASCQKALQWLKDPPPIPHSAIACRHFEPSPHPPTV
jgi:hypothetical protein